MAGAGAEVGLLHTASRARSGADRACAWSARRRPSLSTLQGLALHAPDGRMVPLAELVQIVPVDRGPQHLPQEPAPGGLRHRRRGGGFGEPDLRRPRHEGEGRCAADARRVRNRAALRGAADVGGAAAPEVGRRVADHVRGGPRHGNRLRGRHDPRLRAGGRLVQELRDAADHHGAHPADPDRDPAGALDDGHVLHGDLHDRLHRPGRDHRPQLDPAGGLHRSGAARAGRRWRMRC